MYVSQTVSQQFSQYCSQNILALYLISSEYCFLPKDNPNVLSFPVHIMLNPFKESMSKTHTHLSNFIPRNVPEEVYTDGHPKFMHKIVSGRAICNISKLEATQMLIDSRKNKNNLDIFIQC